jgi:transaldolase
VDPKIVADLKSKFVDFRRAYEEDGLKPEEFELYPPTARTLRGFVEATQELANIVRNVMLPNPDTAL